MFEFKHLLKTSKQFQVDKLLAHTIVLLQMYPLVGLNAMVMIIVSSLVMKSKKKMIIIELALI